LNKAIKTVIKGSKALFKICGSDSCALALRPHTGRGFLLNSYGLSMHMPAVQAELCIEPHLSARLHSMLCKIRSIKSGPRKGQLKSHVRHCPGWNPGILT